jgi:hypothetical protein
MRLALLLALAAFVAVAASASAATRAAQPVLGHPWGLHPQQGYGKAKPTIVSNGGDPTGTVRAIRWTHWGSKQAVGVGISTYVWPGTSVASNKPVKGAKIVAFNLGTCHGRPAYNAIEWYFPKYGETFDAHRYINACNGLYIGFRAKITRCANIPLHGHTAKNVSSVHVTCTHVKQLVKRAPVGRVLRHGGRYTQSGYRCGTTGLRTPPAVFSCRLGRNSFTFSVAR